MITFTPNANVNSDSDDIGTLVLTVTDGNGLGLFPRRRIRGGGDFLNFDFGRSKQSEAIQELFLLLRAKPQRHLHF